MSFDFSMVASGGSFKTYTMYSKYNNAKDICSLKDDGQFKNTISIINSILNEAETRSVPKQISVDHGCNEIKIEPPNNVDSHFIVLKLDEYLMATVLSHSLPNIEKLFKPFGTVESYATMFFSYLEQMELFYGYMSIIDELCCVVDPIKVDTKCNQRLIKIDDRVYLKITVDPLVPSSIVANFYGPTKATEAYRNLYREKIHKWNTNDDIHRNLLRIFDKISFPLKDDGNSSENCSICYTYRLCDQIPIISCDNEKCHLIYHTICLREWFSTVRDSKTFLNVTSGRCPFCKEKLSTSFAQLLEI